MDADAIDPGWHRAVGFKPVVDGLAFEVTGEREFGLGDGLAIQSSAQTAKDCSPRERLGTVQVTFDFRAGVEIRDDEPGEVFSSEVGFCTCDLAELRRGDVADFKHGDDLVPALRVGLFAFLLHGISVNLQRLR